VITMHTLTRDQLNAVVGGATTSTSPYETCRQTMDQAAQEKYPDTRWFFQRWFGAKDGNKDARDAWLGQSLPGTCGSPPTS